ncbi:PqqD family peptide modification chaperone [Streptomyces sp. NPDC001339]|uniref:PqqD family peptide modification chaperone n=1 Tax=Streptomyces sp. NPDC001339 TaxID=3364563 RepID=UPI0036766206
MWQLRERAHPILTDQGGAILDERTGRWTQLTPTAAAAVMLLLSCPTEQAADRFAQRYGIGTEQATTDIRTVANSLTAKGLAHDGQGPTRRWWRWCR